MPKNGGLYCRLYPPHGGFRLPPDGGRARSTQGCAHRLMADAHAQWRLSLRACRQVRALSHAICTRSPGRSTAFPTHPPHAALRGARHARPRAHCMLPPQRQPGETAASAAASVLDRTLTAQVETAAPLDEGAPPLSSHSDSAEAAARPPSNSARHLMTTRRICAAAQGRKRPDDRQILPTPSTILLNATNSTTLLHPTTPLPEDPSLSSLARLTRRKRRSSPSPCLARLSPLPPGHGRLRRRHRQPAAAGLLARQRLAVHLARPLAAAQPFAPAAPASSASRPLRSPRRPATPPPPKTP